MKPQPSRAWYRSLPRALSGLLMLVIAFGAAITVSSMFYQMSIHSLWNDELYSLINFSMKGAL